MAQASTWDVLTGIPKLIAGQALHPLRRAMRGPMKTPETQGELAALVNLTRKHEIRAGYSHRFIDLMFVTVGERVFCRRYSYNEPSWHSAFRSDPVGQVRLDGTVADITASLPEDYAAIIPEVDKAYANALKRLGASFLLAGATDRRAQGSTLEITFVKRQVND